MPLPIYMDAHATTPLDPRVLDRMMPFLSGTYGNPASHGHVFGREARCAVEEARESVADDINADPSEVIFTSGATESNNLVIRGIAEAAENSGRRCHFLSVVTEHHAVLRPIASLQERGHSYTLLNVGAHGSLQAGLVDPEEVSAQIRDDTELISVMTGNNVIGVVQPIREIAKICKERGILFHTDATQAIGRIPFDVKELGVDFASMSAHKFYGPKGVGALYMKGGPETNQVAPQILGGRQESAFRAGTVNVPGVIGLSEALRICLNDIPAETARLRSLRNLLADEMSNRIQGVEIIGPRLDTQARLPNNLSCLIHGVSSAEIIPRLTDVAISNASACASDSGEPSHVLVFLGLNNAQARSAFRFGLSRFTTQSDVIRAAQHISEVVDTGTRFVSSHRTTHESLPA